MRSSVVFIILCSMVVGNVMGDLIWETKETTCDIDVNQRVVLSDKEIEEVFLPSCPDGYRVVRAVTTVFNVMIPLGMPIIDSKDGEVSSKSFMHFPELLELRSIQLRDARRNNKQVFATRTNRCVTESTCYREDIDTEEFQNLLNRTAVLTENMKVLRESVDSGRSHDRFLLLCFLILVMCVACGVTSLSQAKFCIDKFSRKVWKGFEAFKDGENDDELTVDRV